MILLDTHALFWMVRRPERLSKSAASAIRRARSCDGLSIADVTIWELALPFSRGILQSRGTVENTVRNLLERSGVIIKPITPEIAALAAQFPNDCPGDLADRLTGATARRKAWR
jgi:PIN domain nuclease of toxin-antitoxin system